jgi:hypothetical protein
MPAVEPDLDLFRAARLGLEGADAVGNAFVALWCMDTPRSGVCCTLRSHDVGVRRRRAKKVL